MGMSGLSGMNLFLAEVEGILIFLLADHIQ